MIMKNIAIIPARSGSKGLPDKNIIPVNGTPLMGYSIKTALDSGCFNCVMVSTDSERYAEIARECGAEVPFLRSAENSSDTAGSWGVVREVLKKYGEMGETFDYVCLLQPTSPLRTAEDIQNAFKLLEERNAGSVVSVTETDHPVQWCFPLDETLSMDTFAKQTSQGTRRQDLEPYFQLNGAIYIAKADKLMNPDYNLYADNCLAYKMPRDRSVDIDSELDLFVVEKILDVQPNL